MSASRSRTLRPLVGALLAFSPLFLRTPWERRIFDVPAPNPPAYSDAGEILLHGLRARSVTGPVACDHLPASNIAAALLFNHDAFGARRWSRRFMAAALVLMTCVSGLILPFPWALAPPLLFGCTVLTGASFYNFPQSLFALMVLVVAGLMAWRARRPSLARTCALAGAIGASLLYRSPLGFLPAALAAFECGRGRLSWRSLQVGVLLLGPYLFLAPWIWMNWKFDRQVVVFEKGEAVANIARAALGEVNAADADAPLVDLVGAPMVSGDTGRVVIWAAGRIARHPLRYALGLARRLLLALSWYPFLFAAAALGAAAWRRRPEIRAVGALAAYFLGIHCLMAILAGYLEPLRPLLALLGGVLAGVCAGCPPCDERGAAYRASLGGVLAALALMLMLALRTQAALISLMVAAPTADYMDLLESAARRWPEDSWLRHQRGLARINRGRLPEALDDLLESLRAAPQRRERDLDVALTKSRMGDPLALLQWRPSPDDDESLELAFKADIARAFGAACGTSRIGPALSGEGRRLSRARRLRQRRWSRHVGAGLGLPGAQIASRRLGSSRVVPRGSRILRSRAQHLARSRTDAAEPKGLRPSPGDSRRADRRVSAPLALLERPRRLRVPLRPHGRGRRASQESAAPGPKPRSPVPDLGHDLLRTRTAGSRPPNQ